MCITNCTATFNIEGSIFRTKKHCQCFFKALSEQTVLKCMTVDSVCEGNLNHRKPALKLWFQVQIWCGSAVSAPELLYIYVLMGNGDYNNFPCTRLFLLCFLFYSEVATSSGRFCMESQCNIVSQLCAMVSYVRNSPVTPWNEGNHCISANA